MAPRIEVGVPTERRARNGHGDPEDDLHGVDQEVFARVFCETIETLETARLPYALIGGMASADFGRPRWTHDIDLFVRPNHAEKVLESLADKGFETEKTDLNWIFKAFKLKVMVDIIFRSTGGFYLDDEMLKRAVPREILGTRVRFIPPEDLLIIKAVVHDEAGPRHWHDALGIIGQTRLDWDYLLERARRAPRRVLSLLIYAHSLDLTVPNRVIRSLHEMIYDS